MGVDAGLQVLPQGCASLEGTSQHGTRLDVEPPEDVYRKSLIRAMTTQGSVMLTFTPLDGMGEVVMSFLPKEVRIDDGF